MHTQTLRLREDFQSNFLNGLWPLTHVGEYEGEIVAANILGEPREANYEAVPRAVYTDPQAAAVGATEARFSGTAPVSDVSKTATYTHAYAESNGFLTLLSDGERLTGAYALGPEAGEWLQQATLAIRARVPIEVLSDTIQPFPTFSQIYVVALKALRGEIAAAGQSAGQEPGRGTVRFMNRHAAAELESGQAADPPVRPDETMGSESKRVAIITGASQGIGAGLTDAFRRAGYAVVATSRSIPRSAESDFLTVQGDITDVETAQRVVEQALDRFGRIDSLINNAGVYIGKPFTEYTPDDYAAIADVNLAGFFHITQRAIRQMVTQGNGHIVNITTSLVDQADSKRPSALASLTKGGLAAVTRSLAIEYASRGVRVNAVALGVIKTPVHDPESYDGLAGLHPLGRVGDISDVVDGILYLERATFVTGEILHIDGGQAAGH